MIDRKRVDAAWYSGNGLWNVFTGRKKYTIRCGGCNHTWTDKVPFAAGDLASSICPCCGAQNTWSHLDFAVAYERQLAARK
jgi:hypothetical protein